MWKNFVEPDRPQITIKYVVEKMRFACRITKARIQTDTHTLIIFHSYYLSTAKEKTVT
jgi:hypothetical protein